MVMVLNVVFEKEEGGERKFREDEGMRGRWRQEGGGGPKVAGTFFLLKKIFCPSVIYLLLEMVILVIFSSYSLHTRDSQV